MISLLQDIGTIKLRKEILVVLKEEGYQGNDLKVEEFFNQVLLRQDEERKWQDKERERKMQDKEIEKIRQDKERDRIRLDKARKAEERRALELKRINQAKSREKKLDCEIYTFMSYRKEREREN